MRIIVKRILHNDLNDGPRRLTLHVLFLCAIAFRGEFFRLGLDTPYDLSHSSPAQTLQALSGRPARTRSDGLASHGVQHYRASDRGNNTKQEDRIP